MNKKIIISTVLILSACAHHRDVRPSDDGIHKVILMVKEKNAGGSEALSEAENYCEESKQHPMIVSENTVYVGSMDEQTYNNVQTGAKVAEVAGGMAHVFGGKNESNAGGIVGLGGVVAETAAGTGYKYEMKFKCK